LDSAETGTSSSRTAPSCWTTPTIAFSSDDLPAPFGPMIASQPPGSTETDTSAATTRVP
jgi:hypothetical protein